MTRQDAIDEQARLFPDVNKYSPGLSLPEICLCVRGAINGSADPWDDDDLRKTRDMLVLRDKTWDHDRSTGMLDAAFDNCVLAMVRVTVDMINQYLASEK